MLPVIMAMIAFFTMLGIYSAILAWKNAKIGHTELSFSLLHGISNLSPLSYSFLYHDVTRQKTRGFPLVFLYL